MVVLLLMCSCSEEETAATRISSQEDADYVAMVVVAEHLTAAPYNNEGETRWIDQQVDGLVSGHAIVNGTMEYVINSSESWFYRYSTVTIDSENFCNDSSYPAFTGNAFISGYVGVTCTNPGEEECIGSWRLQGEGTLTGNYTDQFSFTITIEEVGASFHGIIIVGGQVWEVSD